MNIPDHIQSLETIFWIKIIKFFDAGNLLTLDPKFGMEHFQIRHKHPGSATQKYIFGTPLFVWNFWCFLGNFPLIYARRCL
jgi:hypothetical protein